MLFYVKNTTFPSLLDLVAPHSCRGCGAIGQALCNRCKKNIIINHHNYCPNCHKPNSNGKCRHCKDMPPSFVVDFRTGLIDELIHDYKYHSVRQLATPLAEILDNTLPKFDPKTIIVPLPTISRHIHERGFDHIALICKRLAKLRHYKTSPVLIRAKNTVQVGSDKSTREKQAASAYAINPKISIDKEYTYLLLDDIWTTGSSMKAAYKKLQQAGARNIIIAVIGLSQL